MQNPMSRQRVLGVLGRLRSLSTASTKPRRPSPYRLPDIPTFFKAFNPLHSLGWRLDTLPALHVDVGLSSQAASGTELVVETDLLGRRLVRAYSYPADNEGWRALSSTLAAICDVVEELNHHPTLTISPHADLPEVLHRHLPTKDLGPSYVLHISTHTHTPLPLVTKDSSSCSVQPGITGKDLQLAQRVEQAWQDSMLHSKVV